MVKGDINFNLKENDCMQIATHGHAVKILPICSDMSLCKNVRIVTNL